MADARDLGRPRDARRMVRYAVLVRDARLPRLNENQQAILAKLAGAGGELPVSELRQLQCPRAPCGPGPPRTGDPRRATCGFPRFAHRAADPRTTEPTRKRQRIT